jgi:Holliday junction resolvase
MLKNAKAKGAKAERRAIEMLEALDYYCVKAGGSLGLFDVIAIGAGDLRCIQVKSGSTYASGVEREQLQAFARRRWPPGLTVEIWRFPDRCKAPLIERL